MNKYAIIHLDIDTLKILEQCYSFSSRAQYDYIFYDGFHNFFKYLRKNPFPTTIFIPAYLLEDKGKILFLRKESSQLPIEWASHSYSHPYNFSKLTLKSLEKEIFESKKIIEEQLKTRVYGFKAPAYNINKKIFSLLEKGGYKYDASIWNSIFILPMKIFTGGFINGTYGSILNFRYSNFPFKVTNNLWEYPISSSEILKLPLHSSFYLALGSFYEKYILWQIKRMKFLVYSFHLIDFVEIQDEVLKRKRGYHLPLTVKMVKIHNLIQTLKKNFIIKLNKEFIKGAE